MALASPIKYGKANQVTSNFTACREGSSWLLEGSMGARLAIQLMHAGWPNRMKLIVYHLDVVGVGTDLSELLFF